MLNTSDISFHASPHGEERRSQRNISIRELQAAVKYGTKERTYSNGIPRWKFTFAGVVYITDDSCTNEVTSFILPLPLTRRLIDQRSSNQYLEAKKRLLFHNKAIITSHIVIVVDKSASMKKSDVAGHKSRFKSVYYTLAEQMVATQLNGAHTGTLGGKDVGYTDVVTLIEMRDQPTIIFEIEPISWHLYNMILDIAERLDAKSHGNYYPSMAVAVKQLQKYDNGNNALTLLFLSDGRPSDYTTEIRRSNAFPSNLLGLIQETSSRLKKRLTFTTVGFGCDPNNFELLRTMPATAQTAGSSALYTHSNLDQSSFSSALTSLVTSTSDMRAMLTSLHVRDDDGVRQLVTVEQDTWRCSPIFNNQNSFVLNSRKFECSRNTLNYVQIDGRYVAQLERVRYQHSSATGFAVRKRYFATGVERIVYQMTELNAQNESVGVPLVAKESKYLLNRSSDQEMFHLTFLKIQRKSSNLATKFNDKLDHVGIAKNIPRITFLDCSIYRAESGNQKTVLVERQLDVERYKKWNNNHGGVDGIVQVNSLLATNQAIGAQAARSNTGQVPTTADQRLHLSTIAESDDEESDDEADCTYINEIVPATSTTSTRDIALQNQIMDEDVPQAFSHFTYVYTNHYMLVCDLQGVLDVTGTYPHFFLTDPCIHCEHNGYKGRKYGRTNTGLKGVRDFFKTHQCNPLCELLGIKPLACK